MAAVESGQEGSAASREALRSLERAVRMVATADLPTPVSAELLGAMDAVAAARRQRLAAAANGLPPLYSATLAISGLALVANAAALSVGTRRRLVWLVGGVAVTVRVDARAARGPGGAVRRAARGHDQSDRHGARRPRGRAVHALNARGVSGDRPAPTLGQHTAEVLRALGLPEPAVAEALADLATGERRLAGAEP